MTRDRVDIVTAERPLFCGLRHWFAYYGMPGSSAPFCVRGCGAPNPRYRPVEDPHR